MIDRSLAPGREGREDRHATGAVAVHPDPRTIFGLRIGGTITASAVFGLVAAAIAPWSLWTALALGFLFGTAFIGGTGYRILLAAARLSTDKAPASWSGATAASALYAVLLWLVATLGGGSASPVLLAFGLAINIAYLPVKLACQRIGCCSALGHHSLPGGLGLQTLEVGATLAVLLVSAGIAIGHPAIAGSVAIAGHLAVRLASRRLRGRWSWGWPPLTQPGAEIAPLALISMLSIGTLVR